MTLDVPDYVNELPSTSSLTDLPGYVVSVEESNPIDEFYASVSAVLRYGSDDVLNQNDFIGRFLFIGLIAATENYFRRILSETISICPISQAHASEKEINLGGVIWHGGERFGRSAFEHKSFANADELKKAFRGYLDMDLPEREFRGPLAEYDKLCQLRHGIVHADGFLPGRNAVKLEIPRSESAVRIVVRFRQLQEAAAVVTNLVVLLNRKIFSNLCDRWAIKWRARTDWRGGDESALFSSIWTLCYSRTENAQRDGGDNITQGACESLVRAKYSLISD